MKKISFLFKKKIINLFTFCFLLSGPTQGIKAQTFNGDLSLTTQAEVDAFNYTEVTGSITIIGTSIINLNGLSELSTVGGQFQLRYNSLLTNVDGLSSLSSIGGFTSISWNPSLTNLDGLSSLSSVGSAMDLYNNSLLSDCCGIIQLVNTPEAVGELYIIDNQTGCESLQAIQNAPCFSDVDGDDVDDEDDNCSNDSNPGQEDADCDGVGDACDLCPGGDDSVDNNGDNIPDCSQLLNYNAYSSDWHCANNKIYVCHNDNNPQTICIDASALATHYNHGDKIGPCTSCPQNLILPASNGIPIAIGSAERHETLGHTFEKHVQIDDEIVFLLNPNPADDHIEIQTNLASGIINVINVSGKVVLHHALLGHTNTVNTSSLMDGIYFIRLENGSDCVVKSIVVMH